MKTEKRNPTTPTASDPKDQKKPRVYARRTSDLRRIRRRAWVKTVLLGMVLAGLIELASGIGSYHQVKVLREPFNYSLAAVGRVIGIPWWITLRAQEDGLLRVYVIHHNNMIRMHQWLRTGNPSGIDYEYELRQAGWSNNRIHALGSFFNVSKGPFQ